MATNALIKNRHDFGSIPLRQGAHGAVYLRDIGTVEDATDLTTGYALVNGRRAVYILATKRAEASTMSVIDDIASALPKMQQELPEDIRVSFEFDQSPYVTRAAELAVRRSELLQTDEAVRVASAQLVRLLGGDPLSRIATAEQAVVPLELTADDTEPATAPPADVGCAKMRSVPENLSNLHTRRMRGMTI